MDFGIGELPGRAKLNKLDNAAGGLTDKQDPYLQGSAASLKDMDLQPPPGALPYLVPKANASRESLHSLSDPRDNPYAAIYSSRPPSPSGTFSPFSDQNSISGRSTRNLLPSTSQLDENNPNSPFKAPSRAPSPLSISEIPTGPRGLSPSKMLSHALSEIPAAYDPSKSPDHSPVREPASAPQGGDGRHEFDSNTVSSAVAPVSPVSPFRDVQPTVTPEHVSPVAELQYPVRISPQKTLTHTTEHQFTDYEAFDSRSTSQRQLNEEVFEGERSRSQTIDTYPKNEMWKDDPALQNLERIDTDVGNGNTEDSEDHAKRIQSVYNEYWNDGGYYDGSEEWGLFRITAMSRTTINQTRQ